MKKAIRLIAQGVVTLTLLFAVTRALNAVVIEGTTPSGKFKTVGLSETGRFLVETATGSLQHVVVDSGTITSFQGGVWNVGTTVGVALEVKASTISLTITGSGSVGLGGGLIYPADPIRAQGVVCNTDPNLDMRIGAMGSTLMRLPAGSCYSPDVPSSFVGDLYGSSTGAATVGFAYIYHK